MSIFVPIDENFPLVDGCWNDYTLVLPCVSVGNVPQLVVDLLINSSLRYPLDSGDFDKDNGNDLKLVGYLRTKCVRPFAGPDPFKFQGNMLATSIQVFVSENLRLVLIQQRSPIYKELRKQFYTELSHFLSPHRFSQTLILSSSFDHFLMPGELFSEEEDSSNQTNRKFPIKYLPTDLKDSELKTFLEDTEQVTPIPLVDSYSMKPDLVDGKIHLPGSGSARSYLKMFNDKCLDSKVVCLVIYCSEGDNRQHAHRMADLVANLVNYQNSRSGLSNDCNRFGKKKTENWETPFSWRSMFGDEPPAGIF